MIEQNFRIETPCLVNYISFPIKTELYHFRIFPPLNCIPNEIKQSILWRIQANLHSETFFETKRDWKRQDGVNTYPKMDINYESLNIPECILEENKYNKF
jgi:hypothetical protein